MPPRTFTFNTATVRVIEINSQPWIIVTDVLAVLGMDTRQSANYRR